MDAQTKPRAAQTKQTGLPIAVLRKEMARASTPTRDPWRRRRKAERGASSRRFAKRRVAAMALVEGAMLSHLEIMLRHHGYSWRAFRKGLVPKELLTDITDAIARKYNGGQDSTEGEAQDGAGAEANTTEPGDSSPEVSGEPGNELQP